MLRRLLKIAYTGGIHELVHNCVQSFFGDYDFVIAKAHTAKDLRQSVLRENDLLLLKCIVRYVYDREARHERRADLILVVGRGDRVNACGRNHALDVVIGEAEVVEKCKQYISRISVAFAGSGFVKLVDDEHEI